MRKVVHALVTVAALALTQSATPTTVAMQGEHLNPTGEECLALWFAYWEAVNRGQPATPPDCVP